LQKLELLLIEALRRDALRQEEGRLVEVGKEFDAVEEYRSNNRDEPVSIDLAIALTFWDAWVDQVHHGFQQNFYQGIGESDWAALAREIAGQLEGREPISNVLILKHFRRHSA